MPGRGQKLIRRADRPEDIEACLAIRATVFIHEQGVAPDLERDGLDQACIHYIAFESGEPVGTARVRVIGDTLKVQRVAVLRQARGTGLGAALMRFVMADLAAGDEAGGRHFKLSSQVHAMAFYEKLGFVACSDEYLEAGIPHREMCAEIVASTG